MVDIWLIEICHNNRFINNFDKLALIISLDLLRWDCFLIYSFNLNRLWILCLLFNNAWKTSESRCLSDVFYWLFRILIVFRSILLLNGRCYLFLSFLILFILSEVRIFFIWMSAFLWSLRRWWGTFLINYIFLKCNGTFMLIKYWAIFAGIFRRTRISRFFKAFINHSMVYLMNCIIQ